MINLLSNLFDIALNLYCCIYDITKPNLNYLGISLRPMDLPQKLCPTPFCQYTVLLNVEDSIIYVF